MKNYLFALSFLVLAWTTSAQAQLITGIGTSQFNPLNTGNLSGQWANGGIASLTSTALTVTGATNEYDGTAGIGTTSGVTLATPVSITGNTGHLSLTGTLNSATPGVDQFAVTLFDSSFNTLTYTFNWSAFSGGGVNGKSVIAALSSSSGPFNGTVSYWILNPIDTSGAAPTTVGFTFDSLMAVAVPEPSTYALMALGLGVVGFGAYRRQKKSVAVRI